MQKILIAISYFIAFALPALSNMGPLTLFGKVDGFNRSQIKIVDAKKQIKCLISKKIFEKAGYEAREGTEVVFYFDTKDRSCSIITKKSIAQLKAPRMKTR